MSAASRLKFLYLAYFSKPKGQRALYRSIRKQQTASIVEIGIGNAQRAEKMISVAQRYLQDREVTYTGIDMFEAADETVESLPLKVAHKRLKSSGAKVNLIPGDPYSALARSANSLLNTDLLLISADCDAVSLDGAWFYIPRMLHDNSLILRESRCDKTSESSYTKVSRIEAERLSLQSDKNSARRAA